MARQRGSERFKALCAKHGVTVTRIQEARTSGHMEFAEINRLDRPLEVRLGDLLELYDDLGPRDQRWLDQQKKNASGQADLVVKVTQLAFSDWTDFEV